MIRHYLHRTLCVLLSTGLVACSAGSGGDSSASVGTNIFGKIDTDGGSVFGKMSAGKRLRDKATSYFGVGKFSSPCTVEARDLDTNAVVATGTSDSNGYYTLTGGTLVAGETYKIIATCGTDVLSSVASADAEQPAAKDPIITNPRSTLIAATIVQAINEAIEAAVTGAGLTGAVADAVKDAIFSSLQNIVATIEQTIDDAIESGAMEEPTLSEASGISNALKTTDSTDTDVANNVIAASYTAGIPATVSGTVDGAATAASALPACDSALNAQQPGIASAVKCTAAISKLMYNVLGFPILVLKSGGALSADIAGNCSGSNATLVAGFLNAEFVDGAASGADNVPADYCLIQSLVGRNDRNRGDQPGDDHKGPMFAESGDLGAGAVVGVLTAIGTEMYNKTKYRFADMDRLVFDHSAGAGMNARLIARVKNSGTGLESFYYLTNANAWSNAGWRTNCDQNHDGTSTEACRTWDLDFGFTSALWSSATGGDAALANNLDGGKSAILSLGVFNKKFGGSIPSMDQLDEYLDNGRIHREHNPSGQREFFVLYTEPTAWSASGNACWDHDTSTPCLGVSGATAPALRVNLTTGPVSNKVSKISDVVEHATGAFYVVPVWSGGKFTGVFSFIKVSNSQRFVDELRHERAVLVVSDQATQCNNSDLPSVGANCADGQLHNVSLDWSSCNGGGDCPSVVYPGNTSTPIEDGSNAVKIVNVDFDYMQMWMPVFSGGSQIGGHSLLAKYSNSGNQKLRVTINGSNVVQSASTGDANSSLSQYNVGMRYNCPGGGSACTIDGFYLVKEDGTVYTDAAASSKFANGTVCNPSSGAPVCPNDVVKYLPGSTATYGLAWYGAVDFDDSQGGTQSFLNTYRQIRVNNGPIANGAFKCSFEPFYIDMNNNGKLDCNAGDTAAVTDVSFSGMWDYGHWLNDPSPAAVAQNRSSYAVKKNDNAYAFKDPVGTKKLLTTAFSGWFDGAHSMSSSTDLNALQNFALVFLFFEEGDGQKDLGTFSGLPTGATGQFEVTDPMEGSDSLSLLNNSIGKAFQTFKQP